MRTSVLEFVCLILFPILLIVSSFALLDIINKLSETVKELNNISRNISKIYDNFSKILNNVNSTLEMLDGNVSKISDDTVSIKVNLSYIASNVTKIKNDVESIREYVGSIDSKAKSIDNRADNIGSTVTKIYDKGEEIEKEVKAMLIIVNNTSKEVSEIKRIVKNIYGEFGKVLKEISLNVSGIFDELDVVKNRIIGISEELVRIKGNLTEIRKSVVEIEKYIRDIDSKTGRIEEEVRDINGTVHRIEFALKELKDEVLAFFVSECNITLEDAVMVLRMDECDGTIVHDSSGHGNDGVIHDSLWVKGFVGCGLAFDGDSYVEVSDSESLHVMHNLTVMLWAKPAANTSGPLIVKGFNTTWLKYMFKIDPNDSRITWGICTASEEYSVETPAPKPGEWHQYALVVKSRGRKKELRAFIDGMLVKRGVFKEKIPLEPLNFLPNVSLKIGALPGGAGFRGVIDGVYIYDRVLSDKEIYRYYVCGKLAHLISKLNNG